MEEKIILPLFPICDPDLVVFPGQIYEIDVGRAFSLEAISVAMSNNKKIIIAMQLNENIDINIPRMSDFCDICVEAEIKCIVPISRNVSKVTIVGIRRGYLNSINKNSNVYMYGLISPVIESKIVIDNQIIDSFKQLKEIIVSNFTNIVLTKNFNTPKDLSNFLDEVASQLPIIGKQKLKLLKIESIYGRLEEVLSIINEFVDKVPEVEGNDEITNLYKMIINAKLPTEVFGIVNKELSRLKMMNPYNSEFHILFNYIECVASLPWNNLTNDLIDIDEAKICLDEDHFGLENVKKRIIEFLAVRKLAPKKIGTTLCLVGPPGVGKAQPLTAKILTPSGFVNMGDIKVGDKIITPSGQESNIIGIFSQGVKDIYKITFSDNSFTRACRDHLWKAQSSDDRRSNKYRIVDTESMLKDKRYYSIDFVSPNINFNMEPILDPYIVGSFVSEGMINTIPNGYKYSSFLNREKLLQGILDNIGFINNNSIELISTCKDILELVQSLGGQASYNEDKLIIDLPIGIKPFTCSEKLKAYDNIDRKELKRYINRIEYDGREEARCILIDHPDHLYITDNYIVTHNTSLGKSIAKAIGRKFIRLSLGGVHDEAEIRGHRRTYVGSLPGKIIQSIKKVGSKNPVFMLDEIDKLNKDFHSDPASALLEVLDPEQNNSFTDNFLGIPFDLSDVMFIMTANEITSIHPALYDRMEIIEIPGYSLLEKCKIAQQHLIPKQKSQYGLEKYDISFSPDAILSIVDGYTGEPGVRNLERQCGSIMRKIAVTVASGKKPINVVDANMVSELLGSPKIFFEKAIKNPEIGLSTGLAWSRYGGSILFVETSLTIGRGRVIMTGNLGKVLQESAYAAYTWIKSNATKFGIDLKMFSGYNIHIHLPAGAVPKDGPSAGVAVAASMLSLFVRKPVRNDIAMTGEITLRGRVLPIGGLKEKILAAHRAGIKEVLYPEQNIIEEVPEDIKSNIILTPIQNLYEASNLFLINKPLAKKVNGYLNVG